MKTITFIIVVLGTFLLSSCGRGEPMSALGSYSDADGDFSAMVTLDTIEINLGSGNSKTLYWLGTWEDGSDTVTSDADQEALAKSITGSQSETKEFSVKDGKIEFEMKAFGMTKTVVLERTSR